MLWSKMYGHKSYGPLSLKCESSKLRNFLMNMLISKDIAQFNQIKTICCLSSCCCKKLVVVFK
jgi:hypothetical protein